jgi:hypothetical protein
MGKRIINKQNKPTYIEYWITNNPNLSIDECEQLRSAYVKENNYQCIEYYRKKYPDKTEEELIELRKIAIHNAQQKQKKNKLGQNNPNSKTNCTFEKRKQNSPYSIEYYRKRYPDKTEEELIELRKKFIDSRKYVKENNSTTLEYYTSRGYSIDDARVMLANRQRTFSLEKCIEKYGETEGYNVFNKRQQKWVKSLQNNFAKYGESRSSRSQLEIQFIGEICNKLNIDVPNKQKYINDKDGCYAYDFTYNHKIIEFNGDYWHCNPQIYNKDFIHKTMKITAYEIWQKDEHKISIAKKHGYDVLVVWESEYLINKDYVIEKCINFLNH